MPFPHCYRLKTQTERKIFYYTEKHNSTTNPIVLGETIDAKTFILDINVLLNDNANINLEMQVINEKNWPELNMLTSEKDILKEASETVYTLTQEEKNPSPVSSS